MLEGRQVHFFFSLFLINSFFNVSEFCLIGLEPKTVISQWYPTKGLYPGRDVEGMFLILKDKVPHIDLFSTKMEPKKLVDGCVAVFTSFRSRISAHYSMNDPARKSWLDWLNKHAPLNESALNYICSHPYNCPLISYFRGLEHRPEWRLTDLVPTFSLFPSLEVLALPSAQCQFNRTGTAEPYMTLNDETNVTNTQSVMQRYTNKYRDVEILRIKRFGTKMLKAILKRKVKHNGAAFTSSGTVEKMAETIFESNLSFFSIR